MTRTEKELLRMLRKAHYRLNERDIARGITRYPKPFQGGTHGNQHNTDT